LGLRTGTQSSACILKINVSPLLMIDRESGSSHLSPPTSHDGDSRGFSKTLTGKREKIPEGAIGRYLLNTKRSPECHTVAKWAKFPGGLNCKDFGASPYLYCVISPHCHSLCCCLYGKPNNPPPPSKEKKYVCHRMSCRCCITGASWSLRPGSREQ